MLCEQCVVDGGQCLSGILYNKPGKFIFEKIHNFNENNNRILDGGHYD